MSPNSTSITDPLPVWQQVPSSWLLARVMGADPMETPADALSLLVMAKHPPGVPVSPLLFRLQPEVNPAGLYFLSNIRLNWTKRPRLYSVPASLEHVFGLAVLLKQEGLSAACPLNRLVPGAAPSLVPKCQSSGTVLRETAVDSHPRREYTYLNIFNPCFTIGANNAIPITRFL